MQKFIHILAFHKITHTKLDFFDDIIGKLYAWAWNFSHKIISNPLISPFYKKFKIIFDTSEINHQYKIFLAFAFNQANIDSNNLGFECDF